MTAAIRLAIVASCAMQHFVHFYRALAVRSEFAAKMFFQSRTGTGECLDHEIGTVILWVDLVEGFGHVFLTEVTRIRDAGSRSVNNPRVSAALEALGPDAVMICDYTQLTQLCVLKWCRTNIVPLIMVSDRNDVRERNTRKEPGVFHAAPRMQSAVVQQVARA